jgi:hypothetical protein
MRITVLFAIVLAIAFATAGFVERQAHGTATGTTKLTNTVTSPTEGVGAGALSDSSRAGHNRFQQDDARVP